jgi:hypothetical protein
MSRQVDWTQPLSDEDRTWASQFSIHDALIQANDAQFSGSDEESLEGSNLGDGEVPEYSDTAFWTKDRLTKELEARQLAVPAKAKRDELVALLEADDAKAATA